MGVKKKARQVLCYTDTGGTFTDTFVVDKDGNFVVGKAPSTPADISKGYFESIRRTADELGMTLEELCEQLSIMGYGATVVVNTILTRTGEKIGVILTKGFEQIFLMGRGKQSWTEYDYIDRIHTRTHIYPEPLVPKSQIRGVTERVDSRE